MLLEHQSNNVQCNFWPGMIELRGTGFSNPIEATLGWISSFSLFFNVWPLPQRSLSRCGVNSFIFTISKSVSVGPQFSGNEWGFLGGLGEGGIGIGKAIL